MIKYAPIIQCRSNYRFSHPVAGSHAYSGAPNIGGAFTNIVQDGKLLPAALAAKQRGVIFDVGHGGGSFDYTVAEPAIAQGFTPDSSAAICTRRAATRPACRICRGS